MPANHVNHSVLKAYAASKVNISSEEAARRRTQVNHRTRPGPAQRHGSTLRRLDFPVALIGQNGIEDDRHTWDECDSWECLFLGGLRP